MKEFRTNAQQIAGVLASRSTHPLSKAVASRVPHTKGNLEVREVRGSGLIGTDANEGKGTYRLGSMRWLKAEGVQVDAAHAFEKQWTNQAATVIGVSHHEELMGVFALRDAPKPYAKEIVERLRREGKNVYLVTGDNRQTAAAIAAQVGIVAENVRAEVRPEGKVEVIQALQRAGERVAFAGDGINDAPALEQADLGIALMNASDVARESADIVLLKADLEAIPEALGLARATLRTIKQNLFWAFFYNAVGVPLAALGFLSPIFSAFAMGMSDLIVIGNALRLRAWKLK
jgi:Cu+-exporting ATPase